MSTPQVLAPRFPTQHAALEVTGWLSERQGQGFVQAWPVQLTPEARALMGRRVTLLARPRTDLWGNLTDKTGVMRVVEAPATRPNGLRFCALGQLRQVDPSEQLVILRIFRNGSHGKALSLRLRATADVLRTIDPTWWTVQIRGGVVGRTLVIDSAQRHVTAWPEGRWQDEWTVVPGVDLTAFPELLERPLRRDAVLRRARAGRCYLNGRPLKAETFEAWLKAGYLWSRKPTSA